MAEASRHVVIGTAGHIDHGKTSLVRALTGADPDRLPEEKKRGITIELGFARWSLGEGLSASVVDVPGHERFVRTMASGAGGIDAVMLVVAADDGVMPQTEEHLAICRLLGVERGLIALTKTDLVDEELVELVAEDVRATVAGTFLEGAPIVRTSAIAKTGLEELRRAAGAIFTGAPARRAEGPAFLPIDRVFTRAGFGTVVTGTLLTGQLAVGDAVDLVPGPRDEPMRGLTVRGLQVHGEATEQTGPGTRVAVNLRGVEKDDVSRGHAICAAGSREPSAALHISLEVLEGAGAVKENDELGLHVGTGDVLARVLPLLREDVAPGTRAPVRLFLAEPVACYPGQRVILRKPGVHGQGTVGGGEVLDPEPAPGKGSFARWAEVAQKIIAAGDEEPDRAAAVLLDARADGLSQAALARRLPPWVDVDAALARLEESGRVVRFVVGGSPRWTTAAPVGEVEGRLLEAVERFHEARPYLRAVSVSELRSGLPPMQRGLAELAAGRLVDEGKLAREGPGVRLAERTLPPEVEAALARVEAILVEAAVTPPDEGELGKQAGLDEEALRDVLAELKRSGVVEALGTIPFARSALAGLEEKVRAFFSSGKAELSTADFKELAGGLSRKYAIPLLEWLDSQGVTRRQGDVRVPRS